jgi:chromosomal replication initiation ATPase DnaA
MTLDTLIIKISEHLKISVDDIKGKVRKREFVEARMIFSYFARNSLRYTFTSIGEFINRHHSTIVHHTYMVNDFIDTEQGYLLKIRRIKHDIDTAINLDMGAFPDLDFTD